MNKIDLTDILETPTVTRPETSFSESDPVLEDFSSLEFEDISEAAPVEYPPAEKVEVEIYNPEENAEILVELIDVANIQTLTPLAQWKLRKRAGGKAEVRKMQLLYEKKFNEENLTDDEKRKIELYQAYLKDKEELEKAIPYTDEEKESLKTAAIPYLKQSQLKIGGGAAFWTQLALIQGSRIMQVLTT